MSYESTDPDQLLEGLNTASSSHPSGEWGMSSKMKEPPELQEMQISRYYRFQKTKL